MGTKQLIILFIAFFLVTACTGEDTVCPGEKTEEKVPVRFRIHFESTATRATWDYDEYFPEITEKEREVSDIMLIVFKNNILELHQYFVEQDFELNDNDDFIYLKNEDGEDLFELEPGPHYFYAILNIPDDSRILLMNTLSGKEGILTRDEFERIIIEKSLEELTGDGNKFIMTNNTPPVVRGIYSKEQIEGNGELNNNINIIVGRAVGKISFAYVASEVQTGELHGKLQDIEYKILNHPKQMYLMPVIEDNILFTPHYTGYASDYFNPTVNTHEEIPWLPATTEQKRVAGDDFAYGYYIENNNQASLKSNSTMLLIKAKFIPAVWLNADGTKGEPSIDGTFWRIGCYNTKGELYAYEQGYYNDKPSDEILKGYQDKDKDQKTSIYDVEEYKEGITYYGFWPKQGDHYMVKRNNYFKIAITHIHGAGVPGPGDVTDPDVDPEDPDTYGRLAVFAVTWIEENVEVTIGEEYTDDNKEGNGNITPSPWEEEEQEEELKEGDQNKFN